VLHSSCVPHADAQHQAPFWCIMHVRHVQCLRSVFRRHNRPESDLCRFVSQHAYIRPLPEVCTSSLLVASCSTICLSVCRGCASLDLPGRTAALMALMTTAMASLIPTTPTARSSLSSTPQGHAGWPGLQTMPPPMQPPPRLCLGVQPAIWQLQQQVQLAVQGSATEQSRALKAPLLGTEPGELPAGRQPPAHELPGRGPNGASRESRSGGPSTRPAAAVPHQLLAQPASAAAAAGAMDFLQDSTTLGWSWPGALVAGPDRHGNYHDDRTQSGARVGTHFNGAWVSSLAGLKATGTDVKSCGQLQGVYQQIFEPAHFAELGY